MITTVLFQVLPVLQLHFFPHIVVILQTELCEKKNGKLLLKLDILTGKPIVIKKVIMMTLPIQFCAEQSSI